MQLSKSSKPKLFVDMDGTLAEWKTLDISLQKPSQKIEEFLKETLYTSGYFLNLSNQRTNPSSF